MHARRRQAFELQCLPGVPFHGPMDRSTPEIICASLPINFVSQGMLGGGLQSENRLVHPSRQLLLSSLQPCSFCKVDSNIEVDLHVACRVVQVPLYPKINRKAFVFRIR